LSAEIVESRQSSAYKTYRTGFVGFVATGMAISPIGIQQFVEMSGAGGSGFRAEKLIVPVFGNRHPTR
jgi:hypothetical protein